MHVEARVDLAIGSAISLLGVVVGAFLSWLIAESTSRRDDQRAVRDAKRARLRENLADLYGGAKVMCGLMKANNFGPRLNWHNDWILRGEVALNKLELEDPGVLRPIVTTYETIHANFWKWNLHRSLAVSDKFEQELPTIRQEMAALSAGADDAFKNLEPVIRRNLAALDEP